jgi:hypothetical protein
VKHGAYFDFMISWHGAEPTASEWRAFIALLSDEISASRVMLELLKTNRLPSRKKYHIFRKPLLFK